MRLSSWLALLAIAVSGVSLWISVRLAPRKQRQGQLLEATAVLQLLTTADRLGWEVDRRLVLAYLLHCEQDLGMRVSR